MRSHRQPRWEHWLLNANDEPLRQLDGVRGGSVTLQGLTRLGGHGTFEVDDIGGQDIDWMQHRVRHVYDPGIVGVDPWSIATHMLTSPKAVHTATGVTYSVETLPKTQIIDEDAFEHEFTLPAGANIIDAVVAVISTTGDQLVSVTPSDAALTNPQSFDAGESKLTIINELLEAAGYWSLWVDGVGRFRIEPYVNPGDREPSWLFEDGQASIHSPDWEWEQNQSSVPNKYIVRGVGDADVPPMVGVATITDPSSPYSFASRGRWVTATEDGFEGANQAAFDQRAQVRLNGALAPVMHVRATHAIVPVRPNDVIDFRDSGFSARLSVQNMEIPFDLEGDVQAEWRRT